MIFLAIPFFKAFVQSDLFGKGIFLSLFILSILSWAILIEKILVLRNSKALSENFKKYFLVHKKHPLQMELKDFSSNNKHNHSFLNLYRCLRKQALEVMQKNYSTIGSSKPTSQKEYLSSTDIELIENQLITEISLQKKFFEKHLFLLGTIISLAPFLGLLGTVWGILLTFNDLQSQVRGSSSDVALTGLSLALATTVIGLLVAIPALIGYNYLKNSIKEFETDMYGFSNTALTSLEMSYREVDLNQ